MLATKDYQPRKEIANTDALLGSGLIKLITGPRRAGKSVFALQMLRGKNYAYLNFDDSSLLSRFEENAVMKALSEVYPGYEYLLLDEIQNLLLVTWDTDEQINYEGKDIQIISARNWFCPELADSTRGQVNLYFFPKKFPTFSRKIFLLFAELIIFVPENT